MPVLTILNHGTMNSSKGDKTLVITKLESLLGGKSGTGDWMINQGAGTWQLSMQRLMSHGDLPGWQTVGGIVWGKGVDENVEKSYKWVCHKIGSSQPGTFTVNLAGHSRGSITCFKIANRLHNSDKTKGCRVNIFAIDPVAGNLGMINSGVYKDIVLQSNINSAYMFLAETERRLNFRPYIDKKFIEGLPEHRMDTIPGNHGGINELKATRRHESGDVVLHHAIKFLRANGTQFTDSVELRVRSKGHGELLVLYATIMDHFMEYKNQDKKESGIKEKEDLRVYNLRKESAENVRESLSRGFLEKNKFGGHYGSNGLGRPRPSRFFANLDHEDLFKQHYGATYEFLIEAQMLQGDALMNKIGEMVDDQNFQRNLSSMDKAVAGNLKNWMRKACGV